MRKQCFALAAVLLAWCGAAETVCVNGVCYPDEEAARAAGALAPDFLRLPSSSPGVSTNHVGKISPGDLSAATNTPVQSDLKSLLREVDDSLYFSSRQQMYFSRRLTMGAMPPKEFKEFLAGESSSDDAAAAVDKSALAGKLRNASAVMAFALVFLFGLMVNLTPCVLPLVPVSLALVGRGAVRGTAYGLGMMLSYGALGLAAAFGGLAFGTIQSSPWFNLAVTGVFIVLGLAMCEVFFIDFSRFRPRPKAGAAAGKGGLLGVFLLGAGTAVLAGACVAPVLLMTLVQTANWYAAGRVWAVALPFVLGAGMGFPWPFITAGLSVLPKPGAWMRWVNRAFAILLFCMAAWYGWLAWGGFTAQRGMAAIDLDPDRPTLVILGAPWCKNCTAMKETTLKDPSVVKALSRFKTIPVEINRFEELANYPELGGLRIMGVPAYIVFEPKAPEGKDEERK